MEKCAINNPVLNEFVHTLTFRESLKCMHYKLWDEENGKMITFRDFKAKLLESDPAQTTRGVKDFSFRNTMNNDRV